MTGIISAAGMQRIPGAPRTQEVVLLACPVLRDLVEPRLAGRGIPWVFLDYGLHLQPRKMAPALQAQLDALPGPRTVLIGYGLCGTGLVGLAAGPHTLIIPRTHDCIAMLLGSHAEYVRAQSERPGTYYLTRGWLESGHHPLRQYQEYAARYDPESALHVIDAMYQHYTDLFYLASSPEELQACRPRVREVADFCAGRWGMSYHEKVGAPALVEQLLGASERLEAPGEDLLVIRPGERVESEMFMRA